MSPETNPPIDDLKCVVPIMRPLPGDGMRVVILSKYWVWMPTHFNGSRCVPCEDEETCELCYRQVRTWKGFFLARGIRGERTVLMQVTPNVVDSVTSALKPGESMNGLIVRFFRLGKEVNSPLSACVLGRSNDAPEVSVSETWKHVCRIYRIRNSTALVAKNPDQIGWGMWSSTKEA